MKVFKNAIAIGFAAALSACGASETVTRDAPFAQQGAASAFAQQSEVTPGTVRTVSTPPQAAQTILPEAILRQINVSQINVNVPTTLSVSEANRYYPIADIVWRGDPIGNRHAQISRIMHEAMTRGTQTFQGPVSVILDIELVRFHAISEKARYTVGGTHNVIFNMQLRDAATGAPLSEPRQVIADLDAFGGQQAVTAESQGLTQKVRLIGHLSEVIRQEMTQPEGYKNASTGFFQLINRI